MAPPGSPPASGRGADTCARAQEGTFKKLPVSLAFTGSDCRHLISERLAAMLAAAGLPPNFRWGEDYWNKKHVRVDPSDV